MPDYKETTSVTKTWRRANAVSISNALGTAPMIEFVEEDATNLNGVTSVTPAGFIRAEYNPGLTFDLLDVETGEPVDVISQGAIYQILHSLYMHLAKQRDML